jgi:hypothetical protein
MSLGLFRASASTDFDYIDLFDAEIPVKLSRVLRKKRRKRGDKFFDVTSVVDPSQTGYVLLTRQLHHLYYTI